MATTGNVLARDLVDALQDYLAGAGLPGDRGQPEDQGPELVIRLSLAGFDLSDLYELQETMEHGEPSLWTPDKLRALAEWVETTYRPDELGGMAYAETSWQNLPHA